MQTRNGILLATLGVIALAPGLVLAKGKRAANVDSPSTAKDPAARYFSSHGVQRHT